MSKTLPQTLGALTTSPFGGPTLRGRSVKDELRANLLKRLRDGKPLFPGVLGYEDTVMPQIVNAILSRHNSLLYRPDVAEAIVERIRLVQAAAQVCAARRG